MTRRTPSHVQGFYLRTQWPVVAFGLFETLSLTYSFALLIHVLTTRAAVLRLDDHICRPKHRAVRTVLFPNFAGCRAVANWSPVA